MITEKDLAIETMLSDRLAERTRQVLQQSQQIAQLEQLRDTLTRERDSLLERIREMEGQKQCAQSAPTIHD